MKKTRSRSKGNAAFLRRLTKKQKRHIKSVVLDAEFISELKNTPLCLVWVKNECFMLNFVFFSDMLHYTILIQLFCKMCKHRHSRSMRSDMAEKFGMAHLKANRFPLMGLERTAFLVYSRKWPQAGKDAQFWSKIDIRIPQHFISHFVDLNERKTVI